MRRSGLATTDRWLLAGLMLTSSVLVAVLTSALTVRGMERSGVPVAAQSIASRAEPVTVLATPISAPRDTTSIVRPPRSMDSVVVAAPAHADSAPQHEDGGAVAPPPAAPSKSPRLSPMPSHATPQHVVATPKREPPRVERHTLAVTERLRSAPVTREPTVAMQPQPQPVPVTQSAAPVTTTLPSPAPAPAAAPPASNAQVLEELHAIHAEIDARRRHVDSLTASLDSLRRVKP